MLPYNVHTRGAYRLALLLGIAPMAGCNHPSPPAIPALSALPNGATSAPPRVNGTVGSPNALLPPQVNYGREAETPVVTPADDPAPGDISLDFADSDIREVVAQILGSILKVNYTIDPTVRGTATLHTVRPLSRSELVPTLESLLAQNGAAVVMAGALYRVVPIAQALGAAASGAGTAGAVVMPLRYASAGSGQGLAALYRRGRQDRPRSGPQRVAYRR